MIVNSVTTGTVTRTIVSSIWKHCRWCFYSAGCQTLSCSVASLSISTFFLSYLTRSSSRLGSIYQKIF